MSASPKMGTTVQTIMSANIHGQTTMNRQLDLFHSQAVRITSEIRMANCKDKFGEGARIRVQELGLIA